MSESESKPHLEDRIATLVDELQDAPRRISALEEELKDARVLLLQITSRERDVQGLADATERLTESTSGLESTLTTVGRAMSTAQEAKRIASGANEKVDDSLVELARSEHRYRRRTRLYSLGAVVIGLLAASGVLWQARHTADQFHSFLNTVTARCESRQAYDQANHDSIGAGITYLQSQIAEEKRDRAATAALIHAFPPPQRAALRTAVARGRKDLLTYLSAEQAAYAKGVIGSCKSLH